MTRIGCFFPGYFEMVFRGQRFDRVDEIQVIVFHQEADSGAVRAAAEAVVELLGFTHGERRCLFIMKRAARGVLAAFLLQGYAGVDDFNDVRASNQIIDE